MLLEVQLKLKLEEILVIFLQLISSIIIVRIYFVQNISGYFILLGDKLHQQESSAFVSGYSEHIISLIFIFNFDQLFHADEVVDLKYPILYDNYQIFSRDFAFFTTITIITFKLRHNQYFGHIFYRHITDGNWDYIK